MIMTLEEIAIKVRKELDRRNLKSNARYRALDKIVSYIRDFHNGSISVLQTPKSEFKHQYENYKIGIGQAFSGAENSAINEIYNQLDSNFIHKTISVQTEKTFFAPVEDDLNTLMYPQSFEPASNLNESLIPDIPGLYAIRIKDISMLPHPYKDELQNRGHNILYIGKATKSLRDRLWCQELNHKSPATFFRSIGAILGYRPIKGSMYGKNTRNYKFSKEDTSKIRLWMTDNLLINTRILRDNIEDVESALIREYKPIINISKNPYKMEILSELRDECVRIAKEK